MKNNTITKWDVEKEYLCKCIKGWQKEEEKAEVTIEDVIEYIHANGFFGGPKWDEFVDDIPKARK